MSPSTGGHPSTHALNVTLNHQPLSGRVSRSRLLSPPPRTLAIGPRITALFYVVFPLPLHDSCHLSKGPEGLPHQSLWLRSQRRLATTHGVIDKYTPFRPDLALKVSVTRRYKFTTRPQGSAHPSFHSYTHLLERFLALLLCSPNCFILFAVLP